METGAAAQDKLNAMPRALWIALVVALAAALAIWKFAPGPTGAAARPASGAVAPETEDAATLDGAPERPTLPDAARVAEAAPPGEDAAEPDAAEPEPELDEALFHGVLVDAVSALPLGGVEVGLEPLWHGNRRGSNLTDIEHHAPVLTEPDGHFAFPLRLEGRLYAVVRGDDYPETFVPLVSGHETRERAARIELLAAARVEGRVLDRDGGPLSPAVVILHTERYRTLAATTSLADDYVPGDFWVEAPVDDGGWFAIDGLSPRAPLDVEIRGDGDEPLFSHPDGLRLEPGEIREVEWRLGAGARVTGLAHTPEGEPIAGLRVWLEPEGTEVSFSGVFRAHYDPAQATRTDAAGRFAFEGVPAGAWLVGPAATRNDWDAPPPDGVAPIATPFEVPEGAHEVEQDVVVHRGLYIRGTVRALGPDPVGYGYVSAHHPEHGYHESTSLEDGAFALGPLAPGDWRVSVSARTSAFVDFARPEPVVVPAGTDDVEFVVEPGGVLVGHVVDDRTGERVEAELSVYERATGVTRFPSTDGDPPAFRVEGLSTGTVTVLASTADGRAAATEGLPVTAGEETDPIELRVAPGATIVLSLESDDADSANCRIHWNGLNVSVTSVYPVRGARVAVPPGFVEVFALDGSLLGSAQVSGGEEFAVAVPVGGP